MTLLELPFPINIGIAYVIALAIIVIKIKYDKSESKSIDKKIKEDIFKCLKNNTIQNITDVRAVINENYDFKRVPDNKEKNILEAVKTSLMKSDSLEKEQLGKINSIIKDLKNVEPFNDLEDDEKNLFNDLLQFKNIISKDDVIFESKLKQLSSTFKNKYQDILAKEKANKRNFWISIAVGFLGILVSYYYGNAQNQNTSIEQKNNVEIHTKNISNNQNDK